MSTSTEGAVTYPWVRAELIAYLRELAVSDPRPIWAEEFQRGLVAGIDQVIHFFFDDHDFDTANVWATVNAATEVEAVGAVKLALDRLVAAHPHGGDDDYVLDPAWREVTRAAISALACVESG